LAESLPLSGIRVFELGSNIAGPYGTWILAALGADVTKVERPEGDDARNWGPPFWNGSATIFHVINRDKRSAVYDLKSPDQVDALRGRIANDGDVVLQNMRPGAAVRLGLGAEALIERNPRLVYCNLHAFGAQGPLKDRPGYDAIVQAFGGIMSVMGEDGRAPVRAGISVIDMGTGMWCAIGILAALFRRTLTGKGGVVDASLFETALGWMAYYAADYQATGKPPVRLGSGVRGIVPYQGYACADGFLMIGASNDRLFVKFADALGHPEWPEDERFATNPERDAHRAELNALIEDALKRRSCTHWQDTLDAAGIPNAPAQSIGEVLDHPQTKALGMVQDTGDPGMKLVGLPLSFDGARPPLRNLAPKLNDENGDG
jgi:crotonobetainyl-CoA:carnitine CoA-transferase CaiB-like acyl-CoA transferase